MEGLGILVSGLYPFCFGTCFSKLISERYARWWCERSEIPQFRGISSYSMKKGSILQKNSYRFRKIISQIQCLGKNIPGLDFFFQDHVFKNHRNSFISKLISVLIDYGMENAFF